MTAIRFPRLDGLFGGLHDKRGRLDANVKGERPFTRSTADRVRIESTALGNKIAGWRSRRPYNAVLTR